MFGNSRLVGFWNEPDSICFINDGKPYFWTNGPEGSMPVESEVPFPGDEWQYAQRRDDGSWLVSTRSEIAILNEKCEVETSFYLVADKQGQNLELVLKDDYIENYIGKDYVTFPFGYWRSASDGERIFQARTFFSQDGQPLENNGIWIVDLPKLPNKE